MIVGIGTDIVAVARLHRLWERHGQRAAERLLAEEEYAGLEQARDKGRFLAKRFAAKEAFAKAYGTGVRPPVLLTAVAVAHDDLGKPVLRFNGPLAAAAAHLRTHLSLSDEAEYAVAFVVLEEVAR
jgi:holo-[acyl-carrier protein] synthase